MAESNSALQERVGALERRLERLERHLPDPTCGGKHPPMDEIRWPNHCHVRTCPRCGKDYPL